jgi:hypothetical protein
VRDRVPFIVDGDKLEVMDLQSRLGTIIDDSKIKSLVYTPVEVGSTVVFGATES